MSNSSTSSTLTQPTTQATADADKIELIDSDATSLTISWTEIPRARRYVLEYIDNTNTSGTYTVLSDKLTSTQARKRNLVAADGPFSFRVRARDELDFIGCMKSEEFHLLSDQQEHVRMEAPVVQAVGNCCAHVRWDGDGNDKTTKMASYELQMREVRGGAPWRTIASSLRNGEVRKRNLTAKTLYQFRVRQNADTDGSIDYPFSPPSNSVQAISIAPGLAQLFPPGEDAKLLTKAGTINLADALAGKVTMLYFSAHWCGPCRQFTPQLTTYYKALKKSGNANAVEVVFVSLDRDESSFDGYFGSMPWLAVPFDDDHAVREGLQGRFRVNSIPRLVILNAQGGVVEENAVGKDLNTVLELAAKSR